MTDVQVSDAGLYTVTSRLSYYAHAQDDGQYLVCIVRHDALTSDTAAQISVGTRLNVQCKG
jgi:hypothetical protein